MRDNIISFRRAKKTVARVKKDQQAAENREKFGRTKAQKTRDKHDQDALIKTVDAHKLSPPANKDQ